MLPDITIRTYIETDFPWINDMENSLSIANREQKQTGFITHALKKENISEDLTTLVATNSGGIVGFITAGLGATKGLQYLNSYWDKIKWNYISEELKNILWIERITVDKKHHGKGIGSILLKEILSQHNTLPILSAVVERPIQNSQAQIFYQKHGFQKIGTFSLPEYQGLKDYQSLIIKKTP